MVYKTKGRRYLKKYTAPTLTPVYSAATDAQAIVDALCDVPWQEVESIHAQMSYHTDKMLDRNVEIRDSLDAAAFCANHAGGLHRAYANAACYVFELPDMETYPNLTSVKARVVSDPYNSGGVRLAVHVADTLEIPVNCATARTGVAHVEGVVPRETRTVNGASRWYAATEEVEIPVGVAAKKYIFLVVSLENYSLSRGDWVEGSAYILPTVEFEMDGALDDWSEDDVNIQVKGREFIVRSSGSIPTYDDAEVAELMALDSWKAYYDYLIEEYQKKEHRRQSALYQSLASDWYCAGYTTKTDDALNLTIGGRLDHDAKHNVRPASLASQSFEDALNDCYSAFRSDSMWPAEWKNHPYPVVLDSCPGPGFSVGASGGHVSILRRKLLVPFFLPAGYSARRLRLSWPTDGETMNDGDWVVGDSVYVQAAIIRNVWLCEGVWTAKYRDPVMQRHELWDISADRVGDWVLVGSYTDQVNGSCDGVDFPIDIATHGPHTLLFTDYIDISEFDLESSTPQFAGTGADNRNIIYTRGGVSVYQGHFENGWDPTVTLIG